MDDKNVYTGICVWKDPTSLTEVETSDAERSLTSDNIGSEADNDFLTETDKSDDGSANTPSTLGIWCLTSNLFILNVNYVHLWHELW